MTNLLWSEFRRLFKMKLFIFLTAGCFLFGTCLSLYSFWMSKRFDEVIHCDDNIFQFAAFIGILSAVFISLFTGKLYSDGTMRNQITAGHKRYKIYVCEYIINFTASVIFFAAYGLGNLIVLYPCSRSFQYSFKTSVIKILATAAIAAVYTAVFIIISMLNKSKAAVAVIALLSAFTLLFHGILIQSRLNEPEMYDEEYYFDTETKKLEHSDAFPNPNYIEGAKRKRFEFYNDFLPTCQAFRIGENYDKTTTDSIFFVYDALTVLVLCTGGIILFKRKDLN